MFGCRALRVFGVFLLSSTLWSAGPALAVNVVGTSVSLTWPAASGPVAGYDVQVSRNGRAYTVERMVAAGAVQLAGILGETLSVRVAAFDSTGRRGPLSPLSDPITFVAPPPAGNASADLDRNGLADALAVNLASGALNAVLLAPNGSRQWVTVGTPRDAAMRPLGFADVDRDGRSDVLFRNGTNGANELWLMRGLTYSVVTLPAKPARFKVAAFRDFSADGAADLLWHDYASGESQLWILGASGYQSALAIDRAPTGSRLVAVADVNGNRRPDLVWQNTSTRALDAWLMQGAVATAVSSLGVAAASASVVGVGDLDKSGVEDLVWRRGEVLDVWFLATTGAPKIGPAVTLPTGSRLRGVVDVDSNGRDDLVYGTTSTLWGREVVPVRVSASTTQWLTRSLRFAAVSSADWQFLTLD